MNKTKIAITLDQRTVKCIDRLVREEVFPSRSQVIQEAVEEKLQRMERSRLAKECAKLVTRLLKRRWPKKVCLRN